MGIMTALAMEYVVSPTRHFLTDFANGLRVTFDPGRFVLTWVIVQKQEADD